MQNQLLVAKSALNAIGFSTNPAGTIVIPRTISGEGGEYTIPWKLFTSLLHGLPPADGVTDDVYVYELDLPHGFDIFAATDSIRTAHRKLEPRMITPNHVPIPANLSNNCPYGPPFETSQVFVMPKNSATPTVNVTVIDSGYIPPSDGSFEWQQYAENFLEFPAGLSPVVSTGERLPPPGLGEGWQPTNGETISLVTVDEGSDSYQALPALVGHANFVTGLVMSRSVSPYLEGAGADGPLPALRLITHDGSFIGAARDVVTEATILRSLCRAAVGSADVINLSYAFPAYGTHGSIDSAPSVVGSPSTGWDIAMTLVNKRATKPMVLCPAGNQYDSDPRFPAALPAVYPAQPLFENIIGVGSSTPASGPEGYKGLYSNYGTEGGSAAPGLPWVTCACDGSDVVSMFLPIKAALEDSLDDSEFDFSETGVAAWNGTCFATAKVTAAICYELATAQPPISPQQAWTNVKTRAGVVNDPDQVHYKGTLLPFL